jgi:hypothetical protein
VLELAAAPTRAPRERLAAVAAAGHHSERARRRVVQLVMVLYLLVLLEGALRKWVAPEYSRWIFFIRDPFLIWAYWLATRHALWPLRSAWFRASVGMAVMGVLLLVVQTASGGFSEQRLILSIHGYRSYFLYAPLAFLVAAQFRQADLARLYRWTLWLAMPIAVLVTAQFFASPGAVINVGIAAEEELQFRGLTATAERVRPMGPFASGAGQQQFVATAFAIALGLFIMTAAQRRIAGPTLWVGTAAVLVCLGLSGSRGTVLQCALAVLFALFVGLIGRGGALKGRALFWTLSLPIAALLLYPIVLPEGHASLSERWAAADAVESRNFTGGTAGRALLGFVDFTRLWDQVPLLGYGLGYGSNASITLKATVDGVMPGQLAETDFARHMVDLGPVFGLAYIGFRFAFTAWLAVMVLRVTRQAADPMPMLLLSYVAAVLSAGQITGQGAINFYGWLFAGVLMAAWAQTGDLRPREAQPTPLTHRRPRLVPARRRLR